MVDPAWYSDWRHEAVHLLQEKNKRLSDRFNIGHWPRYDYDVVTRTMTFSEGGHPKVMAEIQVIGTTSQAAGNWLWGWGNSHWPVECIVDAERTRVFGVENGISELISAYVIDDDLNARGWELTATAVRVCDALGAYRPQRDQGGGLFLLYRNLQWAS